MGQSYFNYNNQETTSISQSITIKDNVFENFNVLKQTEATVDTV